MAGALARSGWDALADGRWEAAREAFESAVLEAPTAEGFEGLSWAHWWLDDAEGVFEARERALHLYRDRGDRRGAARMATWLAADHFDFRRAASVTNGWLKLARRLLEDVEDGPDHGWLFFHEGYLAFGRGKTAEALELATRVAEIGRRFQVADLEMLGLALRGALLVKSAEVAEGMECLDEAAALALAGGGTIPIAAAWACCFLVVSCESVRDYPRAVQWCEQIAAFSSRYGSSYMMGFCRAHYAAVHLWRGAWAQAESELVAAVEAYEHSRPAFVPSVRVALAEVRRRQGRWGEAEALLEGTMGASALLLRAELALDRGDAGDALELAQRALRLMPEAMRLDRAPALEILIRARALRGQAAEAEAELQELRSIERAVGTAPLGAGADLAEGRIRAASGDAEGALPLLEDAADCFERCGAPYEAARARLEIATCRIALGRLDAAACEADSALKALVELGADADARRADEVLQRCAVSPSLAPALTRREHDVLRLVAGGLTNRQIAAQLVISEHTVHRHIGNILRKLDVPTRAAAAAYAAKVGLAPQ